MTVFSGKENAHKLLRMTGWRRTQPHVHERTKCENSRITGVNSPANNLTTVVAREARVGSTLCQRKYRRVV